MIEVVQIVDNVLWLESGLSISTQEILAFMEEKGYEAHEIAKKGIGTIAFEGVLTWFVPLKSGSQANVQFKLPHLP